MVESTFTVQQDFQALRLNESNHALLPPFGLFQNGGLQSGGTDEGYSLAVPLECYVVGLTFTETVTKNQLLAVRVEERPRFRQRTFAGKPLSDEEVIQATQLASEIEDELSLRRLLGR